LKLESAKGPVEILVIDHVEKLPRIEGASAGISQALLGPGILPHLNQQPPLSSGPIVANPEVAHFFGAVSETT